MNFPCTRGRASGAPLVAARGPLAPLERRDGNAVESARYSLVFFRRLGRYRSLLSSAAVLSVNPASPSEWWFSFTGPARMPMLLPCPKLFMGAFKPGKQRTELCEP